jgi:hypothetical protein
MEASSITFSDRSHIQPEIFMEITLDLVQNSDPDTTKLEKLIKFWQIKKLVLYGQVLDLGRSRAHTACRAQDFSLPRIHEAQPDDSASRVGPVWTAPGRTSTKNREDRPNRQRPGS